jgi:hypothetical protein
MYVPCEGTVRNVRCTVLKLTLPFIVLPKKRQLRFYLVLGRVYSPPYLKAETQRELPWYAQRQPRVSTTEDIDVRL